MNGHTAEKDVTEMRLCEVAFVTPRPDRLYVFTVDEGCETCVGMAAPYRVTPPAESQGDAS